MELGATMDSAVRTWVVAHQCPAAHQLFVWITNAGGITAMKVAAACAGALLCYRRRWRVGIGMAILPFAANALFDIIKRIYARPRPPTLDGTMQGYDSFPSGHATTSIAVCCTVAYVFWREGWLGGPTAIVVAVVVPLLVGLSRLYLDVHWTTDVVGGWCVGLLIAVLAAALYELSVLFPRPHRNGTLSHDHFMSSSSN